MNRWGVAGSAAVVVVANAFVLVGVAIDRAGGVVQKIELTERELLIWGTSEDNTGITVRLVWRGPGQQEWLDRGKLAELGFDCRVAPQDPAASRHYGRLVPRPASLVIEYDGPEWQRWVAKTRLGYEKAFPRLTPVDAGKDPEALRRKYPDQSHYLIVPGLIRLRLEYGGNKPAMVAGFLAGLLVSEIHVPLPYARTLAELRGKPYYLTLCYGKRYEPWVCGCRARQP
jgi:hypothetical protein